MAIKEIIGKMHPAFDHRNRLGIMALLTANDWVEYNTLKELLNLTDGNLASHLKALESNEFVLVRKQFIGRKTRTTYSATELGKSAFKAHLDTLEALVQIARENE